ncbi:MAG: hypothetical protein NZ898_08125 [Myxococcota bacterium]|nr:hypothetical protein [Myxococcota bacterium]MDW8363191.1 hypothetical protein [Myxococcales bacterium]
MSIPRIGAPAEVHVETTRPRVTSRPVAARFRDALESSANTLLGGVEAAGALVPGAGAVAAAVRGAQAASAAPSDGSGGSPQQPGVGPDASDPLAGFADESMRLLALQQRIQSENQRFTTLSNVMKARHETAKNAINNIR